jgi:hypothetical protein
MTASVEDQVIAAWPVNICQDTDLDYVHLTLPPLRIGFDCCPSFGSNYCVLLLATRADQGAAVAF